EVSTALLQLSLVRRVKQTYQGYEAVRCARAAGSRRRAPCFDVIRLGNALLPSRAPCFSAFAIPRRSFRD
ncbi:MAG: hypothetical protein DRI90_24530, partial [Deltaproteobacteria bacterium]